MPLLPFVMRRDLTRPLDSPEIDGNNDAIEERYTLAEAARVAAAASETGASSSQTAAAGSATAAAGSATAASGSATTAAGHASAAGTSATLSSAWAEGTEPGGVGTKSAKAHAADAAAAAASVPNINDAGTSLSEVWSSSKVSGELGGKVADGDGRLSDAREWTATTVTQAAAEAGTSEVRRAWTALRVRQAIAAWWQSISSAAGRAFIAAADVPAQRTALELVKGHAAGNVIPAGGAAGALTVGTNDATNLVLRTNGASRATITSAGRVSLTPNNEQFAIQINNGATLNGMFLGSDTADTLVFSNSGGIEKARIDASGNVLVTGSGGLGYGAGSGGTVTQATSKSTTVTLNKPCGQITMSNAALAAGASISFVLTNSTITQASSLILSGAFLSVDPGNYRFEVRWVSTAGSASIRVTNITAGSLSEAVVFNFAVIRGATS